MPESPLHSWAWQHIACRNMQILEHLPGKAPYGVIIKHLMIELGAWSHACTALPAQLIPTDTW